MKIGRETTLVAMGALLASLAMVVGPDVRAGLTLIVGLGASTILVQRAYQLSRQIRTPILLMGIAGLMFLLGSSIRMGLDARSGPNFPSIGEAVLLVSYGCIFASLTLLARLRRARPDQDGLTDALVVACGVALTMWSIWLVPYVRHSDASWAAKGTNVVFAMLSAMIIIACTRLATGPGARTPSLYLLMGSVTLFVVSDLAATASSTGGSAAWVMDLPEYFGPWIYLLFGAAVVHPSATRLAEPPSKETLELTRGRTWVLMGGLLTPPAILALAEYAGIDVDHTTIIVGWVAMTYLVLVRFTRLVTGQRRATDVQRILRDANAELASASNSTGMHRAGLKASKRLVDAEPSRVSFAQLEGTTLHIVDAVGADTSGALGASLRMDDLPNPVRHGLRNLDSGEMVNSAPVDLTEAERVTGANWCLLILPIAAQGELTGAMIVTTPRPLAPTLRQSIETLASTLALALESAALTEDLMRRKSERRFRVLVENSSDIVLVVDPTGVITFASPASHRLLGLPAASMINTHPARWLHPEDWATLAALLEENPGTDTEGERSEVRLRHVDGSYRWFELHSKNLYHDPEIQGRVITAREITDRKEAEQMLATSEARFRALVQSSSDVVAVVDEFGTYTYVSPAVTEVLGYRPEELEGASAVSLLDPADLATLVERYPGLLPDDLPEEIRIRRFEAQVLHRSGERRTIEVNLTDMRNDPAIGGVVLNARDVTVRKELEHDLLHQAEHDTLTGLANRVMFTSRTAQALAARPAGDIAVGALFVDLDDFKTVNDSLGHAVGDQLLRQVADRLDNGLTEATLAARLGGDEFAILIVDADEHQVHDLAERVLSLVAEPFVLGGREIHITCSVGIAMATAEDDADAKELLRSADVAMYVAKERGKNSAAVFEEHLHASVFQRLEMKADLVRAVEDGQLRCFYQPIVSLQTGRITGVEALVRWQHPERGLLAPDEFIPLAEDTGLVVPLGRWVLREACQQLRQWQLQLAPTSSLTMSVNLSVRQLVNRDIVGHVREAVEDAQIDASTLTLEITETTLMHDTEVTRHRLAQLRELGVSLAVDDFGTGYSSLQYVQRFPIDIIKIDQSFVAGLGTGTGEGAVVQSMIELSQRLGVHTVAEGIETPDQVTLLRSLGADLGQGYWFSRPVPAERIDALLAADPTASPRFSLR